MQAHLHAAPRLACVKPVASVHPEPGSNSTLYIFYGRIKKYTLCVATRKRKQASSSPAANRVVQILCLILCMLRMIYPVVFIEA